jgi:hypothetical protein
MVAKDWDFNYTIKDSYKPVSTNKTITLGNVSSTYYRDDNTYTVPSYTYSTYWYPTTIYMYQIFCPRPRCKGVFWGAIDSIAVCPKCKSRVKVTDSPPPDYEVEVTK